MDSSGATDSVLCQLEVATRETPQGAFFKKRGGCVLTSCALEMSRAGLLKSTGDLPPALMDSSSPSAVDIGGATRMRHPRSTGYERGLAFGWVCKLPRVRVMGALMMDVRPGQSTPVLVLTSDTVALLVYAPDAPIADMEHDWFGVSAVSSSVEQFAFGSEASSLLHLRMALASGLSQFDPPAYVDTGQYHISRSGALSLMRLRLPVGDRDLRLVGAVRLFAEKLGIGFGDETDIRNISLARLPDATCVFDRVCFFDRHVQLFTEREGEYARSANQLVYQIASSLARDTSAARKRSSTKRTRATVPVPTPSIFTSPGEARQHLVASVFGASAGLFTLFRVEGTWANLKSYIFGDSVSQSLAIDAACTANASPVECLMALGRLCMPPHCVLAVQMRLDDFAAIDSTVLVSNFERHPIHDSEVPRHSVRWACRPFVVLGNGHTFAAVRLGDVCRHHCRVVE